MTYDERKGYNNLSCWFNLSYASFLTLPRVAMENMPDEWQEKMAELLNELDDYFPNFPSYNYRVQRVDGNKLSKFPKSILNYRHPDYEEIKKWKKGGGSCGSPDWCGYKANELKDRVRYLRHHERG